VGFYPVEAGTAPYDAEYFARYKAMASTPIGYQLSAARVNMVARHWDGPMIDVGIGSGAFITARNALRADKNTFGYDVNPDARDWLMERGLWRVPEIMDNLPVISLWDVLEHIPDFRPLLSRVRKFVFISIPIFTSGEHVLRSKHYRQDEHVWYFTTQGLIRVMFDCGFTCVESNTHETELGREDIGSFVFQRDGDCKP